MKKNVLLMLFILFIINNNVWAVDVLYYSVTDGTVRGVDISSGNEVSSIPSTAFNGAIIGAAREIAVDPVNRLMWYTATDDAIYSINLDSLSDGPSIASGRISGAGVGGDRHLYIDYARRHLLVTTTSGSIQRFDLDTQADVGDIPATFFTDGNVGIYRHLASDVRTGSIWYAATDGSFREFNPDSLTHTGRQISFGEQVGANPGAYRHFVIDPNQDLLMYTVTDGSLGSIPLSTLTRGSTILGSNIFVGANPGAGRVVSYDIIGFAGGHSGHATFASNYLILPFVNIGTNEMVSALLRFDASQGIFLVEHYESTNQTAVHTTTYDSNTGNVTIPKVDYLGSTYNATLNQIPGTLNFMLQRAEIE